MSATKQLFLRTGNNIKAKLTLKSIIYEKGDDGFLVDCEIVYNSTISHLELDVSFNEWDILVGQVESYQQQLMLQEITSGCINQTSFITKINFKDITGKDVMIHLDNDMNIPQKLTA